MTRPKTLGFAALGALCALGPVIAMWGFSVDDALIPIRYARHLATGAGYRFDRLGPSTDGVTPLPWAFLLSPLARGDALVTLAYAKVIGASAWTLAASALGVHLAHVAGDAGAGAPVRARTSLIFAGLALGVVALAFPIGAWAASGLETGLATALATASAISLARPRRAAIFAGLASTLRPELAVWAVAVAVGAAAAVIGRARRDGESRDPTVAVGVRVASNATLAVAPFALCAAIRMVAFGRPAPLAVLAKPSDFAHGVTYAAAASVVVLTPLLAFAPIALASAAGARARILTLALVAHVVAVTVAGGDWMPYARLMVPVAPSLAIAFVDVARVSRPVFSAARLLVALAVGAFVAVKAAPAGRHVGRDREELVLRARPILANARIVAALDIGWVSAATDAVVVDLAGLTDPQIASLPGGHTSKRVDVTMLLDRGVDTMLVYSEPRVVEIRIIRSELFGSRFERAETIPFGVRGASYVVYRRIAPAH